MLGKQQPAHGAVRVVGAGDLLWSGRSLGTGTFTEPSRTHWERRRWRGPAGPWRGREEGGLWVLTGALWGRAGRVGPLAGGEVGAARSVPAGPGRVAPFTLRALGHGGRGDAYAERMKGKRPGPLGSPAAGSQSPCPTASPHQLLAGTPVSLLAPTPANTDNTQAVRPTTCRKPLVTARRPR